MEEARQLRLRAAHLIRLSKAIYNPADVAQFEALAADANRDAAIREAVEADRLAGKPPPAV